MNDHDRYRYMVQLLAGGINLLAWFIVVNVLAIVTLARARWSGVGKLTLATAVCFTIFAVTWGVLMIWYPPWYRSVEDSGLRLAVVAIMASFYITLTCCIAVFQPTVEARRLVMRQSAGIGVGVLGATLSQLYLEGWLLVAGQIFSGLVILVAVWFAQRAPSRLGGNSPKGNHG
jgi:hypothetical protein